MNMLPGELDKNYEKASCLIRQAAGEGADVILLPETWNTGFFPRERLEERSDKNGERTKKVIGDLARETKTNIVAGSVAVLKEDGVYNTSYVFNRRGECVAEYSKTHLFTPMGEDSYFNKGSEAVTFELDGMKCGVLICYDIRFPELTRTLALQGIQMLFLVSQWPSVRIPHLMTLTAARAIENQMFLACCNSCGVFGETVYGGNSVIYNPLGEVLSHGGETEEIIFADCDFNTLRDIRESINVFRDRRSELYNIK